MIIRKKGAIKGLDRADPLETVFSYLQNEDLEGMICYLDGDRLLVANKEANKEGTASLEITKHYNRAGIISVRWAGIWGGPYYSLNMADPNFWDAVMRAIDDYKITSDKGTDSCLQ